MVAVLRFMFSLSKVCLTAAPLSTGDLARFGMPGELGGLGGEPRGTGGMEPTVCALGRRSPELLTGVRVEKTGWRAGTAIGGFEFGGGGRGMDGGRLRRSEVGVFTLTERGPGEDNFLVGGEGGRTSMTGAIDES